MGLLLLGGALLLLFLPALYGSEHLLSKVAESNQGVYDSISSFSKDCKGGVFLDFGSNRGVQLYKLFDPHAFLGAQLKTRFQTVFGQDLSQVCAISFEPNPHHVPSIAKFSDYCRSHFKAKILQLSQVALWSQDGNTTFYLSPEQKSEEGASLFRRNIYKNPEKDQVPVRLLSTAHVLKAVRKSIGPTSPILVKMDIEGAEFEVLRSLFLSGALCMANEFNIEYHQKYMKSFSKDFHKFVRYIGEGCNVSINSLDDETGILFQLGQPAVVESSQKAGEGDSATAWIRVVVLIAIFAVAFVAVRKGYFSSFLSM